MKRAFFALVLGVSLAAGPLYAGSVTINWAPVHSDSGGEFVLTTTDNGTFNSFCIERNEHVSLGGTYTYTISGGAIAGGLTGATGGTDPLSIGTAYLYRNFRDGSLANFSSSSATDEQNLQNAFWWLEGEIGVPDVGGVSGMPGYDPTTNPYLQAASAALSLTLSQLQGDANGAYGVYAMNLKNPDGSNAQDMLGLPDRASTLAMLGIGFALIALSVRRNHAAEVSVLEVPRQ